MIHDTHMPPSLLLAVVGMALLAFGVWRMESVAVRRIFAILLCTCGLVFIGIAAAGAGSNWGLRISAFGMYSAAGGALGLSAAAISLRRRAGAILADLGMIATTGFKIIAGLGISAVVFADIMQLIEGYRPSRLILVGQTLFISTFAIQTLITVRGQWRLADQGIIGTHLFVPWQQISGWDWQDSKTLSIELKQGVSRGRILTISVVPEAHDVAAAILARRVGGLPYTSAPDGEGHSLGIQ